jgi:hypothetical protein
VDLKVDPVKVGRSDLFRLEEWKIALIVSQRLQEKLVQLGTTGITFAAVNGGG